MIKSHSAEKQALVNRYLSGESVSCILADAPVSRSTLYAWIQQYSDQPNQSKEFTLKNFRILENKVKRLEGMVKILQTAGCAATSPLSEKLIALEALHGQYSVHMLCEALDVSRSTFYNHIFRNKKGATTYAARREELKGRIQEIFHDNDQIFGAQKIAAVMKSEGYQVSAKTVLELMREMDLISIRQNSKAMYLKEKQKMKNCLNQEFHAEQPNQVWVSDVTYFRCNATPYYICVIIDLFSRKVVAHKISCTNSTQLVKSTFKQAYGSRNPNGPLIFHNDQGTNYCSNTFRIFLKSLGVEQSFSRTRVPYDNSVAESFFASMKKEELYRRKILSLKELGKAVDRYIDFHNTKRPHHSLKYRTPEQVEAAFAYRYSASA